MTNRSMCAECGERPAKANGLCGRCYKRRRRKDPVLAERDREASRAWKARNRERTRVYDREYDAAHRIACQVCGASRRRDVLGPKCARCLREEVEHRRERIAAMWSEGLTLRRIAVEFGWSVTRAGVEVARMRQAGYDLPGRAGRVDMSVCRKVRERYEAGEPTSALAEEYGRSQTTIAAWVSRAGGVLRRGGNASKTHCPRGHPYAGENLLIRQGRRYCRACRREAARARQRKEATPA